MDGRSNACLEAFRRLHVFTNVHQFIIRLYTVLRVNRSKSKRWTFKKGVQSEFYFTTRHFNSYGQYKRKWRQCFYVWRGSAIDITYMHVQKRWTWRWRNIESAFKLGITFDRNGPTIAFYALSKTTEKLKFACAVLYAWNSWNITFNGKLFS